MQDWINTKSNTKIEDEFYIKSKTKKNAKIIEAFDIDGTLTENITPFNKCKKKKDTVCGLVSHRTLPYIFHFSENKRINPDFVCSASFELGETSKAFCLEHSKKKFPNAEKGTYTGDMISDEKSATKAGFDYIDASKWHKKKIIDWTFFDKYLMKKHRKDYIL